MRRTDCFSRNISNSSLTSNGRSLQNNMNAARKTTVLSSNAKEETELFKLPFKNLSPNKRTKKSVISPTRRVQCGRVKNNRMCGKQMKLTIRPYTNIISADRKSFHSVSARNNQARKNLIQKMVYLTECAIKENKEIKQSTPKRTPKSRRTFLVVPELAVKKLPNIEETRAPVKDFLRNENICSSIKKCNNSAQKRKFESQRDDDINISLECTSMGTSYLNNNMLKDKSKISCILTQFQNYSYLVDKIYKKLQVEEKNFQQSLEGSPEFVLSTMFFHYQMKKQELYDEMKNLDDQLITSLKSQENNVEKLKIFVKENHELLAKQLELFANFNNAVHLALEKIEITETSSVVLKDLKTGNIHVKEEWKLRRSPRLSKLPQKIKKEEITPNKKKLKNFDSKSRTIKKVSKSSYKL